MEIFSHLYSDFLQKAYHVYNIKAFLSQNCFQKYWSMLHMTVIDFPLIRNGITSGVHAMDGLLERILHWYILECSLLQTPAALCIGKIWSCPDTNPVFRHGLSTVVVKTPCDFLCHYCGAVRLTCLVCIQGCVVTPKWLPSVYYPCGWVQLTAICTNPKCLLAIVGLCSIALLCQTPVKAWELAMYLRKAI